MKVIIAALILSSVLAYNFTDYCNEFHKEYPLEEQWNFRKGIFDANYSAIEEINSQGLEYTVGPNNMTDWTQGEVDAYLKVQQDDTVAVSEVPEELLKVSAPLSVNWNTSGKVTPIKNQGYCGSCWSYATTATFESYLAIKKNIKYDLSQEYLLECTASSNCGGGIVEYAFSRVVNYSGMPTETSYPYKAYNLQSGKPTTAGICTTTAKVTNTKYTTSKKYGSLTQATLKNLVAASPLAVLIYANSAFMSYKTGIFSCTTKTTASQINHAITLIGYDANGNWLIKNSWGTGWGIGGFGWMKDTYDCGIKLYAYQFTETAVASYGANLLLFSFVALLGLFLSL